MSRKRLSNAEINETLNNELSDLSEFSDSEEEENLDDDDVVDRDKDYIPSSCSNESDVEDVPSTLKSVDKIICISVPPPSNDSQESLDNLVVARQSTSFAIPSTSCLSNIPQQHLSSRPSTSRSSYIPPQHLSSRPSTSRSSNIPPPDFSSTPSTSRVLEEQVDELETDIEIWQSVGGERTLFSDVTLENTGVPPDLYTKLHGKDPIEFFNHLLDNEIIGLLVTETNRFASQTMVESSLPSARIKKWSDTNAVEMRKFIGILFWMNKFCKYIF